MSYFEWKYVDTNKGKMFVVCDKMRDDRLEFSNYEYVFDMDRDNAIKLRDWLKKVLE